MAAAPQLMLNSGQTRPPTARTGGVLWPSTGFLEAYNSRRYEGEAPIGGIRGNAFNSAPIADAPQRRGDFSSARSGGSAEEALVTMKSGGKSSAMSEYGYSLIRSDVDEDVLTNMPSLPQLAGSKKGVRGSLHRGGKFQKDDKTEGNSQLAVAWVESTWFQSLSGLVIFINAIIIGLETDIESNLWIYPEQALLVFFVFELSARLLRYGLHFFNSEDDWVWNLFDFSIVMSGVFDTWMMPAIKSIDRHFIHKTAKEEKKNHMSVIFMLMRMLRLLRIVRLFRLVRIVRPLFELAMGVMEALQGMFWVLVFMIMTLYATAILCTRLIGHGTLISDEDAENDEELANIRSMFGSVEQSMFSLFGTVSSWSLLKFVPLFEEMPVLRPLFVTFYVYSAWALLAVMTGVVSENMIAIREQMIQEDKQKEEIRRARITEHLIEVFRQADSDGSGTVTREEFNAMLAMPDLVRKIQRNSHLRVSDMQELFEWIDYDMSGAITIDEFMKGFKWMNDPLRAKSLVKLQEKFTQDLTKMETRRGPTRPVELSVNPCERLPRLPNSCRASMCTSGTSGRICGSRSRGYQHLRRFRIARRA
eukprot:TRINITY_DN27285_c0_g1_i2.p1 TRINITY_DN27285_c0_g1~~TRINITY_DN27285_c0_g1_i2.p1  ORF type:complete len:589 (-),score=114.37 TRINITY_DN27285_c0_g1_i2:124-1890(-)